MFILLYNKSIVDIGENIMDRDYPVDSKLKLNQYRLERKPANTNREKLEKQLEIENYGQMIRKQEAPNKVK